MNPTETTLEPGELDLLQEVFDSVRKAKGIEIHSTDASNIAARIIELYQSGVRDREQLQHVAQRSMTVGDSGTTASR